METIMEKKNIDWGNLGFSYLQTDKRYVSNYKDGAWDEGTLTSDATVQISECAGVLQYAQTVFEGLKAYATEDGHIVTFRPSLNAARLSPLPRDWRSRYSRRIVSLSPYSRLSARMPVMYRPSVPVQLYTSVLTCLAATLLSV